MEAVVYSTFRNHLKDYMKKVNDEFEPLTVVNKNPDEDIVVISKSEWDSIQETLRVAQNKELSDKVLRGMAEVRAGQVQLHEIEGSRMLLKFTEDAWKDYCYWQSQDNKTLKRINTLIKEIQRDPFAGIGKPEPLKYDFQGAWSRRIDAENRLIYMLDESGIAFLSFKDHY